MTDLDKKEIRGITGTMLRWFIGGTFTVCATVISTGIWVTSSIKKNTEDIITMKAVQADHAGKITDLRIFQAKVEMFFDKPKEIKPVFNNQ